MSVDLTPIFERIALLDRQASHSAADRKSAGITYTPPAVVRDMVALVDPGEEETIHEPSCGRGAFVFGLVEHWLAKGKSLAWIDGWAARCLWCSDIDADAVADLHKLWEEFFLDRGHEPRALRAHVQDGLFGAIASQAVDLVIGNPPYVRVQHLDPAMRERVRAKYPACATGNVDLYYAFFSDALLRARRVCYIMPNSWLANASARALRKQVLPRLSHLVDFGSRLVFAPVRAYTCIVLCDQGSGPIHVRGNLPCEGGPWTQVSREDSRWDLRRFTPFSDAIAPHGQVLSDQAEVISGIATLADHAFTLPAPEMFERDGQIWVRQVDPLHEGYTLEVPAWLAPRLLKATRTSSLGEDGPRILCPYDENWKIIPEQELARNAPDLLAWLGRRRAVLDGRDKGKTQGYEAWYAYGRRQGFWNPQGARQVVLLPQMGNGSLAPVVVDMQAIGGRFLFTSGYVLRPRESVPTRQVCDWLLAPRAWEFVQREGRAWAGKGEYMTIGARSLRNLPIE